MRVVVAGSRTWDDPQPIRDHLEELVELTPIPGEMITIIHGAARGADMLADGIARSLGYDVIPVPANWQSEGRRAGIMRNCRMLDYDPEFVLAFIRGESPGTSFTCAEARRRGIEVIKVAWETRYYGIEATPPLSAHACDDDHLVSLASIGRFYGGGIARSA